MTTVVTDSQVSQLARITLTIGSDWRIELPTTVNVDGTATDWESSGYLMLQYRTPGSSATPTRWKTSDGASRYDSTNNAFLVPDDDAIQAAGAATYFYDLYYVDGSDNPKLVGRDGELVVEAARTGVSGA